MNKGHYIVVILMIVGITFLHQQLKMTRFELKQEVFKNQCFFRQEMDGVRSQIAGKISCLENRMEVQIKEVEKEVYASRDSLQSALSDEKYLIASLLEDNLKTLESNLIGEVVLTSSYHKKRAEALQYLVRKEIGEIKHELVVHLAEVPLKSLKSGRNQTIAASDGKQKQASS